jgi:DNA-binding response OmpR family regulator
MKILLVEDESATRAALELSLSPHYSVETAADGKRGLEMAKAFDFDLILLDVMLPELDGLSICQRLRADRYHGPILLLTAKDSRTDRILGLDAGADDYLVKPCDPEELLARIRALLRRGQSVGSMAKWGDLTINSENGQVNYGEKQVHLTPKEFSLLELFLLNPQRAFNRSVILDRLWDFAESPSEETVSTHIKCLRQKLKAVGSQDPIETVYGLGYRLRPAPDPPAPSPETVPVVKLATTLAQIWEKSKDQFESYALLLTEVAQELKRKKLTPDRQKAAEQAAHKLAGTLGMFGMMDGSQLARQLENSWGKPQPDPIEVAKLAQQILALLQTTRQFADPPIAEDQHKLLIIDDDQVLADRLRVEAIAWGFEVEIAQSLQIGRYRIEKKPPDVVLLDLNFPGTENGLDLLTELMARSPRIPVLAFTGRGDLADRLQVAKRGGCLFLHKPLPSHAILQAVTEVLERQASIHQNRVLVADDDSTVISALSALLKPVGIEVLGVPHLQHFWDTLTTTAPNLLILDLEMPEVSGIEICQAIRSDLHWRQLPILFFSAHATGEEMDRAFAAGADDYISKSVSHGELISRIQHRLRRAEC